MLAMAPEFELVIGDGLHAEVQQVCIDSIRSGGYSFRVELKCRAC
jgi:hypothetical protein